MLTIKKGQINEIPATATELLTVYPADYLFRFWHTSGIVKIVAMDNISPAQTRWDLFMLQESETEDLYNGKVNFKILGEWDYEIHQMPLGSPPSLDLSLSVRILETGKVNVVGDSTPIAEPNYTPNYVIAN